MEPFFSLAQALFKRRKEIGTGFNAGYFTVI